MYQKAIQFYGFSYFTRTHPEQDARLQLKLYSYIYPRREQINLYSRNNHAFA